MPLQPARSKGWSPFLEPRLQPHGSVNFPTSWTAELPVALSAGASFQLIGSMKKGDGQRTPAILGTHCAVENREHRLSVVGVWRFNGQVHPCSVDLLLQCLVVRGCISEQNDSG